MKSSKLVVTSGKQAVERIVKRGMIFAGLDFCTLHNKLVGSGFPKQGVMHFTTYFK